MQCHDSGLQLRELDQYEMCLVYVVRFLQYLPNIIAIFNSKRNSSNIGIYQNFEFEMIVLHGESSK